MSRYTVAWILDSYGKLNWQMNGPEKGIPGLTEAEAHIIAFALNAVAEGKQLIHMGRGAFTRYDGPTEGVAP